MVHTFNPSTLKVETGTDLAGWREEYKEGGDRSSGYSLRIYRDRILPTMVLEFGRRTSNWLLFSLIFQHLSLYLTLDFY